MGGAQFRRNLDAEDAEMNLTPTVNRPSNHRLDGRRCFRYLPVAMNTEGSEPVLEPGVNIKDVEGFEGFYKVTDDGRVWSTSRTRKARAGSLARLKGRWLKPSMVRGYPAVSMSNAHTKRRTRYVHDLVAAAFIGPRPEGHDIDHLDRDRANNSPDNLRYVSRSANLHNGGAKGFGYCKVTGKWDARISRNNKKVHLGRFDTPEEARAAYVAAKQKLGVPNF